MPRHAPELLFMTLGRAPALGKGLGANRSSSSLTQPRHCWNVNGCGTGWMTHRHPTSGHLDDITSMGSRMDGHACRSPVQSLLGTCERVTT
eukprot:7278542-Pyramimonas_sp.AAC.2